MDIEGKLKFYNTNGSGFYTTLSRDLDITSSFAIYFPNLSGTLVTTDGAQSLTGKTGYNGLVITSNTGAITAGSWHGTAIDPAHGGTGVANNTLSTMTISGNYSTIFTIIAATNVTFPITGRLATLAGIETFTNKTFDTAGNVFRINGNQITAITGTGNIVVLSSSPTISGNVGFSAGVGSIVYLKASATSNTYILTLPTNVGESGNYLKNTGSGILDWGTPSSISGQSGYSGYSGLGISGYSGLGISGYSSKSGYSGVSGYSGGGSGLSISGYSGYSGGGGGGTGGIGIKTQGGTVINPTGAINVIVWYAPYICTVTKVRGYRIGGTGATINARKNGTSNHLNSALSLTSENIWMDGGTVESTTSTYAIGDKLEIMVVSQSGNPTQVSIQVDFNVPGLGGVSGYSGSGVSGYSGGPGGSDTQVQFNDGGGFGGSAGFTYNKTNKAIFVGSTSATTPGSLFQYGADISDLGGPRRSLATVSVSRQDTSTVDGAYSIGLEVMNKTPSNSKQIAYGLITSMWNYGQSGAEYGSGFGLGMFTTVWAKGSNAITWGQATELYDTVGTSDLVGYELMVGRNTTSSKASYGLIVIADGNVSPAQTLTAAIAIQQQDQYTTNSTWGKGLYAEQSAIGTGTNDSFIELKDHFRVTRDGDIYVRNALINSGLYPWTDVRSYGATTSDLTTGFNAAVTAGEKFIYIPTGTWTSTGQLLTTSGIYVKGAGKDGTIISSTYTGVVFQSYGVNRSNLTISDLAVNCNSATGSMVVYFEGATFDNITIKDCHFYGAKSTLLFIAGSNHKILNNIVDGLTQVAFSCGIWIRAGAYNLIKGNTVKNVANNGIALMGTMTYSTVVNNILYGNHRLDSGPPSYAEGGQLALYDESGLSYSNIFSNNNISNGGAYACGIELDGYNSIIAGNIVHGNEHSGISYHEYGDSSNSKHTIISSNIVYDNGKIGQIRPGIWVWGGVDYFNITGNICYDSRSVGSKTQSYGIQIESGSDYYIVTNNVLVGNATGSLSDNGGIHKQVANNLI